MPKNRKTSDRPPAPEPALEEAAASLPEPPAADRESDAAPPVPLHNPFAGAAARSVETLYVMPAEAVPYLTCGTVHPDDPALVVTGLDVKGSLGDGFVEVWVRFTRRAAQTTKTEG